MRTQAAEFTVVGCHVDGRSEGTLRIEPNEARPGLGLVEFRPKGARRVYALPLPLVAEMIAWRCAKLDAERERRS